ncbi:MAG: hypothetical protein HYT64_01940 [Candidatus Yanofskybacteria bacterium]|nr:hypothetical protein [Candidatus Yanofskybacteria bacterium]
MEARVSVELPKDVVIKFRDGCHADPGNHPWIVVYSDFEPFDTDFFVYWCPLCGSVVVDAEVDGRLMTKVFEIKSPQIASKMSWDGKGQ